MKSFLSCLTFAALFSVSAPAATINWSAGVDNGFSLSNGNPAPIGTVVRLGWFRDSGTGLQLTDSEILALASTPSQLNAKFVEAASSTIGSGLSPAIASHFSAASTVDTGAAGLNITGRQMYLWVLNGAVATATQQAILYWDVTDTATNPDGSPQTPGTRWVFPGQDPIPGNTTIDVSDLTTGSGALAAGAKVLVGTYPGGTSPETSANNFALEEIDQPLSIVTGATLPGGIQGVSYSVTLSATGGRSPYDWTITSGGLPGGLNLAGDGEISGTPSAAGTFSFTATVTDDLGTDEARAFTLVIAATDVSITTASALPDGIVGGTYSQTLASTGGTAPYSYALESGSLPGGVNLSSAGEISGVPGDDGVSTFAVTVTDANGLEDTKSFTLEVVSSPSISTPSVLPQGVVGTPYSVTFSVTGGGSYTWTVASGALPGGLGLGSNGELSGTPNAAGTFNFTLDAEGPTGNVSSKAFTLVINASLVAPTIDQPTFPVTSVSSAFSYTLTASPSPTGYSASGLPSGLKLNTTTGVISGRATVSGVFVVKVKAKNGKGFGAEAQANLIVQALPNGAVGSFIALIDRETTVNGNLGGRIDLTTTATGAYTLKFTQGTVSKTVKGSLDVTVGQNPTLTTLIGASTVSLTLVSASNSLTGDVSAGMPEADVTGWKNVWNKTTNPASSQAGYYSFGIDLAPGASASLPQGSGFASFTVALDGKLTVTGKTSDGNAISTAGFIGADGRILVYQQLYAKLGTLQGVLNLAVDPGLNFTENTVSGDLTWSKPATTSRTYPGAFGPQDLDALGKYLARASTGSVVLGLPAFTASAALDFSEGGLVPMGANPDVSAFTYTTAYKVIIPPNHPTKTTLTINQVNGTVGGSFTLEDGTPGKVVKFSGMTIRNNDGTTRAVGYFLRPQIPVGAETPGNSPILSGKVKITQ